MTPYPSLRGLALALFLAAQTFAGVAFAAPPSNLPKDQHWVLALTWHPAFCETVAFSRAECADPAAPVKAKSPDHLVLHGLWPQGGEYCGVADDVVAADKAGRWETLPEVVLPPEVSAALDEVMPGRLSRLDRHEWIKHGTCSGLSQTAYFELAIDLARQARVKAFTRAVYRAVGETVSFDKLCLGVKNALGADGTSAFQVADATVKGKPTLLEMRVRLRAGADARLDVLPVDAAPGKPMDCAAPDLFVDPPGR